MTANGMRSVVAMEGATTGAVFEAYVEMALAPALRPGQVVVMDNLGAHRSETTGQTMDAVSGRDARVGSPTAATRFGISFLEKHCKGPMQQP